MPSFLKTIFRSLWKSKGYNFLNIFGLAIGIGCAGLIFLWVSDELSYDGFHTKKDRLFYVLVNQQFDAGVSTHGSTPGPMAPAIREAIPGIANTCRATEGLTSQLFAVGSKAITASGIYAEPSLFTMFTLPFAEGNAKTVFSKLHSLVITEKAANKFFGTSRNVVGKTILVDNKQEYIITGVLKDFPGNSSLGFEWVAPYEVWLQQSPWAREWLNYSISTFVELKPGVSAESVNKHLYGYLQRRSPDAIAHPFLHGMDRWRLHGKFDNGKPAGGRIEYVQMFSIIACIILLIACINFMNLATARSEKRAKEVGVRKVLGAEKKTLVVKFITEAILMAVLATIAAVFIMALTLPLFNELVGKNLSIDLTDPYRLGILASITSICGLVAGSYPSFYLSSFNPVFALKGIKMKDSGAAYIRKGLVVLQFTLSIVFIIATIIIYKQINHVKDRELGFEKNNLVGLKVQGDLMKHFGSVKQALLNTRNVQSVALSDYAFIYGGNNTDALTWPGKPANNRIKVSTRSVDPNFFPTSRMKVLEGRNFRDTDTLEAKAGRFNIVITASLAKMMGRGSAVGKIVSSPGRFEVKATVVGVVNDYVYENMYGQPDPVMFTPLNPGDAQVIYVRLKEGSDVSGALSKMESIIKKNNPAYPFSCHFVGDQFNKMFSGEMLVGNLSKVFAGLAIIISCLGLFGLAAYTAERRTKEIGIRKVLGVSVKGVTALLSRDFLQLICISCIVAFPISWWAMNTWLQNYQYRTELSWWVFAVAGIGALVITLITVSFHAVKAAFANPVKSLRTE